MRRRCLGKDSKEGKQSALLMSQNRAFQAEGAASTKAPRWVQSRNNKEANVAGADRTRKKIMGHVGADLVGS